jgi:hypothetical protein
VYSELREQPAHFWTLTRHTVEEFEQLCLDMGPKIAQSANPNAARVRAHKLTTKNRLLLVLIWLSTNCRYDDVGQRFDVSQKTVCFSPSSSFLLLSFLLVVQV